MLGIDSALIKTKSALTKTNSIGREIWRINLFFLPTDLSEHQSGYIFVVGGHDSLILNKIDTSGTIMFQKG